MAEREQVTRFGRLLGGVADEHHEATGGENDSWADWYAERLEGRIDEYVGFHPPPEQISAWLTEADRRYRAENPDIRWPFYYAELILDTLAASDR